jgi:NADPH:quinone reductase-like Zn-dependent oxidoreductase
MHAVELTAFGPPKEVLHMVDLPEPGAPKADEILVQVELAPINFNDLYIFHGTFHYTPELPTLVGNEGLGRVLSVGSDVRHLKPGNRVLLPRYSHTWRERMVVAASRVTALPPHADVKQLAMLRINPLAAGLLLSEFVDLQPGDWILQNAANSGVGRAVIAFAKARGFKTLNVVRRRELVPELQAAGGDVVLTDDVSMLERIRTAVGGRGIRLALDGVGGTATARLVDALSPGGHLVGYAYMGGREAPGDLRKLMEKEIRPHAFYEGRAKYDAKIPGIIDEAKQLVASGKLFVPVAATYPLREYQTAIAHAERGGKVLLDMQAA